MTGADFNGPLLGALKDDTGGDVYVYRFVTPSANVSSDGYIIPNATYTINNRTFVGKQARAACYHSAGTSLSPLFCDAPPQPR